MYWPGHPWQPRLKNLCSKGHVRALSRMREVVVCQEVWKVLEVNQGQQIHPYSQGCWCPWISQWWVSLLDHLSIPGKPNVQKSWTNWTIDHMERFRSEFSNSIGHIISANHWIAVVWNQCCKFVVSLSLCKPLVLHIDAVLDSVWFALWALKGKPWTDRSWNGNHGARLATGGAWLLGQICGISRLKGENQLLKTKICLEQLVKHLGLRTGSLKGFWEVLFAFELLVQTGFEDAPWSALASVDLSSLQISWDDGSPEEYQDLRRGASIWRWALVPVSIRGGLDLRGPDV